MKMSALAPSHIGYVLGLRLRDRNCYCTHILPLAVRAQTAERPERKS